MKKLICSLIMLLAIVGCSTDPENQPKFELKRVDIIFDGNTFIGPDERVEIPVDEPYIRFIVHAYNEIPICSQVLEIYNDKHELYLRSEIPFDPCLGALTNEQTEAWTIGFELFLVRGTRPEGNYIAYVWIKSSTGQNSPYDAVDIYFGSLKHL